MSQKYFFSSLLISHLLLASLLHCACSTPALHKDWRVQQIFLEGLQFRQPSYLPANPEAYVGESDFKSQLQPNAHWDCVAALSTLKPLVSKELFSCLQSLAHKDSSDRFGQKPSYRPSYRLSRGLTTRFELQEKELEDKSFECLKKLLPSIPVPREIFYQSQIDGQTLCFSSHLELPSEHWNPLSVLRTEVLRPDFTDCLGKDWPDGGETETLSGAQARALQSLLLSWILTPYWYENNQSTDQTTQQNGAQHAYESSRVLHGQLVPDAICAKCMEGSFFLHDQEPAPPQWPLP